MVSFQKEFSCRDSFVSAVSVVPQEHSTVLQPDTNSAICHKLIKNELCCSQLTGFIPFTYLAHTSLGFFFPPSFVVFFPPILRTTLWPQEKIDISPPDFSTFHAQAPVCYSRTS